MIYPGKVTQTEDSDK